MNKFYGSLKLFLSEARAILLAFVYDGYVNYHHINSDGYWEFKIEDNLGNIHYKTKGLRGK